jgi:hypothetical protein
MTWEFNITCQTWQLSPDPQKLRYGINIRTGRGCPKEWLSGALQAGALDDELNVLIFSRYVEFSAA